MDNDFEKNLEVPKLEEPDNLPQLVQHISVVQDALEKCEKILEHLAAGNYSEDFEKYLTMHIELIAEQNRLNKKLASFQKNEAKQENKS